MGAEAASPPACHPVRLSDLPAPGWYVRHSRAGFEYLRSGGGSLFGGGDARRTVRVGEPILDWPGRDFTLPEFERWWWSAMDRRINARAGIGAPRGRKDDPDWEIRAWRDSRRVRDILTTRLRVYQFETDEARRRFGHLLARRDD